ncbi:MAG: twin-arginine translocation pathway signal [Mycobacterium sp.]
MTVEQDRRIDEDDDVNAALEEEQPVRRRLPRLRPVMALSRRGMRRVLTRWRIIALTVAVVAAVALAAVLFFFDYRPIQQTDDAAAHAAIKAASEGTVAILSCTPQTIDHDLAVAKSHMTGPYLKIFNDFGRYYLAPTVRQHDVKVSATVLRAAVSELHPDSAVVLVFVHQTTTSKEKPEPALSTNSVRVTLAKVDGSWLIAKFEPE